MLLYPRMSKRICLTSQFPNFGLKAHEHSHVLPLKAYPFCVKTLTVYCWLWNIHLLKTVSVARNTNTKKGISNSLFFGRFRLVVT
jgi:hypothetical protein